MIFSYSVICVYICVWCVPIYINKGVQKFFTNWWFVAWFWNCFVNRVQVYVCNLIGILAYVTIMVWRLVVSNIILIRTMLFFSTPNCSGSDIFGIVVIMIAIFLKEKVSAILVHGRKVENPNPPHANWSSKAFLFFRWKRKCHSCLDNLKNVIVTSVSIIGWIMLLVWKSFVIG